MIVVVYAPTNKDSTEEKVQFGKIRKVQKFDGVLLQDASIKVMFVNTIV